MVMGSANAKVKWFKHVPIYPCVGRKLRNHLLFIDQTATDESKLVIINSERLRSDVSVWQVMCADFLQLFRKCDTR